IDDEVAGGDHLEPAGLPHAEPGTAVAGPGQAVEMTRGRRFVVEERYRDGGGVARRRKRGSHAGGGERGAQAGGEGSEEDAARRDEGDWMGGCGLALEPAVPEAERAAERLIGERPVETIEGGGGGAGPGDGGRHPILDGRGGRPVAAHEGIGARA